MSVEVALARFRDGTFRLTRIETDGDIACLTVVAERPFGALHAMLTANATVLTDDDVAYYRALAEALKDG